MLVSGLTAALQGIQLNQDRFASAADRIARHTTMDAPEDVTRDLVDLKTARYGMRAILAVFRAADEMVGTLLDVLA